MSKSRLHIIIASTRPGRVGPAVADWFHAVAKRHGAFDTRLVDLADFNLPLYDEPRHPRLEQYAHDHTRAWSASVDAADAFVFVTPEYNYNPTPALINALNYVYREWNYKPAGFVSYGGLSGGLRAVEAVKPLLTTLKMMPMVESVAWPFVFNDFDEEGQLAGNPKLEHSATVMLDELARWTGALKTLRAPATVGTEAATA